MATARVMAGKEEEREKDQTGEGEVKRKGRRADKAGKKRRRRGGHAAGDEPGTDSIRVAELAPLLEPQGRLRQDDHPLPHLRGVREAAPGRPSACHRHHAARRSI
eukprot:765521-Hanusia_phi.AAC.20